MAQPVSPASDEPTQPPVFQYDDAVIDTEEFSADDRRLGWLLVGGFWLSMGCLVALEAMRLWLHF